MKIRLFVIFSIVIFSAKAQSVAKSTSEIYDDLLRLQKNATVMYLAAHPDDENTRLISWITHQQHLDVVYLSLTRGDGGQNLIGSEKAEKLGLIRTQELLQARKIDKGRQMFTRAIDFGYSKTATETFTQWNKQTLLADVVWAIRKNQPQIIITRFSPESNGKTHGHHTASAILAQEAFSLAADPKAFPEQLKYVSTWQPKTLYYNTGWWMYGSQEKFNEVDKSHMIPVNVGSYYPLLGTSNNEIAALSRSKHACQAFGMAQERGEETEWLEYLQGEIPSNQDLLSNLTLDYSDQKLQTEINQIIQNFDFKKPKNSVPALVNFYKNAQKQGLNSQKINQIKDLILATSGIYFEWTAAQEWGTAGQNLATNLEIIQRSQIPISWRLADQSWANFQSNQDHTIPIDFTIPEVDNSPYWLQNSPKNNLFKIDNQEDIGLAEKSTLLNQNLELKIENTIIPIEIPLQYKYIDPGKGEIYQPFYVVPAWVANFNQEIYVTNNQPIKVGVEVQSFQTTNSAEISIVGDHGWKSSEKFNFKPTTIGEKKQFEFTVTPGNSSGNLKIQIQSAGKSYSESLLKIAYPHIPTQVLLQDAKVQVENLDPKFNKNQKIGYIMGSGDDIPKSLQALGLNVNLLDLATLTPEKLSNLDAIIIGIRAFNTQNELKFVTTKLWKFVENGGLVIVQYQTPRDLVTNDIAPLPLSIGRSRIAEEKAELTILQPNHQIFNFPNKIEKKDFDHWVQERGLYFADEWSDEFVPLLSGHDQNEPDSNGILLIAKHGKGQYIFTGLSFFRELPAGVTGAYKLFLNLLNSNEKSQ